MIIKRSYFYVFSFVIMLTALFAANTAKACHLAAADIYIEYAGKGVDVCNPDPDYTYDITLVTYSYCNCTLTTGNNETVFYQSENGATGVLSVQLSSPGIDTVDQLCPAFSVQSQCRVPANAHLPGYKRRTYTGTITLPSGQSDWKFWWSDNARNPSNNLVGTGSLYIEAGMDVLSLYYNNTPKFLADPLPYICEGQEYNYLNLPYDPDPWDSNRVNVTTEVPKTGANSTVTYQAGYNQFNPINGYSLDSKTGTATFFPNQQGRYTVSFKGEDKYSYVLRDVQFAVLPCTAPPPSKDDLPGNLKNATIKNGIVYACPGSDISFDVNGWSENPNQNIYMRSDITNFSGASFTTSGDGTDKVTGTFEWTPSESDYGPHNLVITTVDSTCDQNQPVVLRSNTVVRILVVPGLDAGPDLEICQLNPQPIQLFVKGSDSLDLKWSVVGGGPVIGLSKTDIHNPVIQYPYILNGDTILYPENTGYIVATTDLAGACKAMDTVWVTHDTSVTVNVTPKNPNNDEDALVLCRPNYLQLEALIKGRRPLNNVPCGMQKPTLCDNPETLDIYGSPLFGEAFYDSVGNASPIMYTNLYTSKKQYLITKEELWQWGLRSATIRGMSVEMAGFDGTDHEYNITISFKCTDLDELNREDGFINFGMTTVFSGRVTLADGWNDFKFERPYGPYNWDTTKNLIVQICYNNSEPKPCTPTTPVPVMKYAPTSFVSALMYKPAGTSVTNVCDVSKGAGVASAKARPVMRFAYCEAEPLPFDIKWLEGAYLSDSTIAQPLAYIPETERFIVQTIGRSKCIMRDTLEVYVPDHDYSITPEDTAFCLGDEAPFLIHGGHHFKWYEYIDGEYVTPISVSNPARGTTFVSPQKTTDYRIVVSDSVWCYDTISARVEILPLPDVKILNEDDTTIKYGQPFKLLAQGARLYNWSPVSSLNNPNISYPIAKPTEDTRYIVGGIAANGCRSFDTLHVRVDKSDNLFVPSAFSPNGDGKNDVFRVSNLSFQKIMEFRVFNRWGQEIFSTSDNARGWDGTWEGVPQEIGTYNYLIRVAYPDGFIETYKGETTLIR